MYLKNYKTRLQAMNVNWKIFVCNCTIRRYFNASELPGSNLLCVCRESRRANAALRFNYPDDLLHIIYPPNGTVSAHFPKRLIDLSNLDGVILCQ